MYVLSFLTSDSFLSEHGHSILSNIGVLSSFPSKILTASKGNDYKPRVYAPLVNLALKTAL